VDLAYRLLLITEKRPEKDKKEWNCLLSGMNEKKKV